MFSPMAIRMLNSSINNRLLRTYIADKGLKQLRFMPWEIILACFTSKNIPAYFCSCNDFEFLLCGNITDLF